MFPLNEIATETLYVPVFIADQFIGHKVGEFVSTRTFKSHIKTDKKAKR